MGEIRLLRPDDDRLAVSRVYEESWRCAYRGIVPQDYLDGIEAGRWAANLSRSDWHTLICTDGGRIVGTSSFSASRFARFSGWGEIISLYLLPAYMGRGYGRLLLDSAVDELKKRGYERIFLWVLAENDRARRFYEKAGFLPTGDYRDDCIGGKALREISYAYCAR